MPLDESGSSSEESSSPSAPANGTAGTKKDPVVATKKPVKKKWEGEDEEESGPASDWEESSSSEEETAPKPTTAAPPKKKGTLKAKLAEKEAEKAKRATEGVESDDYDEDAVLDPREKARLDRERELKSDLNNAADLFGQSATGTSASSELNSLLTFNPRTKDEFHEYSKKIIEVLINRLQDKPLYPAFVEQHVRDLAMPLRDVEVRKAASGLTTLANEKQKEQRDKASGKKKSNTKANAKATLGSAKGVGKIDTGVYDEALDDFGNDPNDFM
ncbi:translation initiation factor eIF3 subunit [Punctularia strigosozonata HHB-11173 SS5]|uniref:translation initiation factor eIF3 subunit n=1 Tax=Punctularia strigosozonata (strain HHB-11173) TaxID=741275 RepID=UPI0004417B2E|nr:translation initiation factor eIF3 subunit [Punctularia strigosozonata HHB-11173 SS5]EIN10062.1 translation initiation factor eIF3 subunit [Punctularia strigosozonata HHB-11173 SS5]